MNTINLIGNTCNELEVKITRSGKSVLSFNLAVKRPFTKNTTDFFPIVVWDQGAEYLGKYGRKGSKVAVSGKLTTRKYTDGDGNNRTVYEIVADTVEILDSRSDAQGSESSEEQSYIPEAYSSSQGQNTAPNFEEISSDDNLPF